MFESIHIHLCVDVRGGFGVHPTDQRHTPNTRHIDDRCTIWNAPARAQGNGTQALLLCYSAAVFGVCPISGTFCFDGRGQDTNDAEFAYTHTHTHTYRSRMPDTPIVWEGACVHMLFTYNIIFRSRYIHSTCTWKEIRARGRSQIRADAVGFE